MKHSNPNRPSRDPIFIFFHVICCRASQKNTVLEVLDSLGSISPEITQKIENATLSLIDLDEIVTVNLGEGQNFELRNIERPIFRNFKIASIKVRK